MSQVVVYKGVVVRPVERADSKILVRTDNPGDAQKAGIPFKDLDQGRAIFEAWVSDNELSPVNLGDE